MPEEISEFLKHFNLWKKRKVRQGQALLIPQNMWNNIKDLHQKYPDQDLKQLLSVNENMWSKKILGIAPPKKKVVKKTKKSAKQPFLLMPETTLSKKSKDECLVLHLSLKNGVEVRIYQ